MSRISDITRRLFLAATASLAAWPRGAQASGDESAEAALPVAPKPPISRGRPRWETATAEDLKGFVGQRFRVSSPDLGAFSMRLTEVKPVRSGPARPAHLTRAEALSAIFESPDIGPLVAAGHGTHGLSHPRLGTAQIFMGPIRERNGAHVIEVVLN